MTHEVPPKPSAAPPTNSASPSPRDFLDQLFGMEGQVAVVIGGTGVLGGAISEGLASAGATVVIAGRGSERGEERVASIHRKGRQASYLPVDVTSHDSIRQLLDEVVTRFDQVDMLVNCAGVNSAIPYEQIPDDEWDRVLQANLTATHWACQSFAPPHEPATTGGIDPQYRQRLGPFALVAGVRLLRFQSRRGQPHAEPGA